jgi:hypothetical protein
MVEFRSGNVIAASNSGCVTETRTLPGGSTRNWLVDLQELICLHVLKYLIDSTWPMNLQRRFGVWAEPKVNAFVA